VLASALAQPGGRGAANPIRIVQVEDLAPRFIHALVACVRPAHGEGRKHVA
jgi:hypothetical protein